MKKHNFYAGPSRLSDYTLKLTAEAITDFAGTGLSVMGISHRSAEFKDVMDSSIEIVKELLRIPEGYSVLFLQGGASLQFCMAAYNLLDKNAAYVNTGIWATKALQEAKLFGDITEIASSKDKNFSYIPKGWEKEVHPETSYVHITTNNTIVGTQYKSDPDVGVPLVADMSSDLFSRPVDVSKYALIYAGAQKNIGPSGVALVIVKDDLLGKFERPIPKMLDYRTHIEKGSMYNTPPTVAVFACLKTLERYRQLGGVDALLERANIKAQMLYNEIDRNKMFEGTASVEDRSNMNITFVMSEKYKELEPIFLEFVAARNILGIKGHRSVGGFRASCYNAQREESVKVLVKAMSDFEKRYK
ncbi:MAG: 3-phosphoserine/phosphohydroxythreonine transaminase [Bacteroidales bacterium]|jgi:phosphoserine aminotransferase|nr:3-phosphoserine/phosphohydroxythreonine transaminase [Bacteroidales bacterium]